METGGPLAGVAAPDGGSSWQCKNWVAITFGKRMIF